MSVRVFLVTVAIVAGAFWIVPSGVLAQVQTDLFLDSSTMQRGFTVENADTHFRIGIFPDTFNEGAQVVIRNINDDDLSLPAGMIKVSNAYEYDIKMNTPQVLNRPLFLETTYFSYRNNDPSFYFYNGVTQEWESLPSQFIKDRGVVRTRIPFPYSKVVLLEPMTKGESDLGITVDSQAALVMDADTGAILFEKNGDVVHPLASVTKLMTAMVFLEHNPGWDQYYTISSYDQVGGSHVPFSVGEKVKVRDLFNSMLISSANNSAQALARLSAGSTWRFVQWMNEKADDLGLTDTHFEDVTGLNAGNVSTPKDIATLARIAFDSLEIHRVTTTQAYQFYTLASTYTVHNTDTLLGGDLPILGSKTGYISASGYNLVLKVDHDDRDIIVVIFGASTRESSFFEAEHLSTLFK
jgi:hypothetical protein